MVLQTWSLCEIVLHLSKLGFFLVIFNKSRYMKWCVSLLAAEILIFVTASPLDC